MILGFNLFWRSRDRSGPTYYHFLPRKNKILQPGSWTSARPTGAYNKNLFDYRSYIWELRVHRWQLHGSSRGPFELLVEPPRAGLGTTNFSLVPHDVGWNPHGLKYECAEDHGHLWLAHIEFTAWCIIYRRWSLINVARHDPNDAPCFKRVKYWLIKMFAVCTLAEMLITANDINTLDCRRALSINQGVFMSGCKVQLNTVL